MPAYDYRCDKCGTVIEIFWGSIARASDAGEMPCSEEGCDGVLKRLVNSVPFKFASGNPIRVLPGGSRGMD